MLHAVAIPPHIFDLKSYRDSSDLRVAYLLAVLHSVSESGLLVVPVGAVPALYNQVLDAWPINEGDKAKACLARIVQRGRFVSHLSGSPAGIGCVHDTCRKSVLTAGDWPIIYQASCIDCLHRSGKSDKVDVDCYFVSPFFARLAQERSFVVQNKSWSQADFESYVLHPVTRFARCVKIIDRYVGRTAFLQRGRMQMKPGYRKTLEWLISSISASGRSVPLPLVEVYCGVKSAHMTTSDLTSLRGAFDIFSADMQKRYGISLTVYIKSEDMDELPHARYLITDQVSLLLERGFELLTNDWCPTSNRRLLRDFCVTLVSDCNSVDSYIRGLPDI